jgi:hypothetical protein
MRLPIWMLVRTGSCALACVAVFAFPGVASAAVTPDNVVVSTNPANWTPQVLDGAVFAIEQVGSKVVVGGDFTQVKQPGGSVLSRPNIFAFDAATGTIDPNFVPALDRPVEALAGDPSGTSVFVGGRFAHVNGFARKGLTQLDLATGARITAFKGKPDSAVYDLAVVGSRLLIGGNFGRVNGVARMKLAAVDLVTGALDPGLSFVFAEPRSTSQTTGSLHVKRMAATPDGSRLVIIGNFSRINGQERHQLAVIDLTTSPAQLANWATDRYRSTCPSLKFPAYLRDVDLSPDGSWFAVVTTGAYGAPPRLCDTTARWELGLSGIAIQPTWVDYTGGDTLLSVAVTDSAVYTGGHQRWTNNPFAADRAGPGAVARSGISALDVVNGLPLSWNPGRKPRGEGAFALVPTADGLWVGSDTEGLGGEIRPRLGFFPAAGGTPIPAEAPAGLPGHLYRAGPSDSLARQAFDGTTPGPADVADTAVEWSRARGAMMLAGLVYTGWSDGALYTREYDGAAFGPPTAVDLHGLTSSHFPLAGVTSLFFDPERRRMYYTLGFDSRLFYRYFTPESMVVGAETFVASGVVDGFNWRNVRGMTLASGRLYFAETDGVLRSVAFAGGVPVPGTLSVIDGPPAGQNWVSNGLFMFSPAAGDEVFRGSGTPTEASWHVHPFTVSAPQTLTITLDWDDPAADLDLFLMNPSGTTVEAANDASKPKTLTFDATTSGTWSVAVKIRNAPAIYQAVVNP